MQELEKILEEMRQIKDGNRKENLYAKYPPNGKDQEVLNAYSQGYEDGTDNFYNAIVEMIRKHMNDGWISVEERLPDNNEDVLVTTDAGLITFGYFSHGKWITDQEPDYPIAWRPLPEAYLPERKG